MTNNDTQQALGWLRNEVEKREIVYKHFKFVDAAYQEYQNMKTIKQLLDFYFLTEQAEKDETIDDFIKRSCKSTDWKLAHEIIENYRSLFSLYEQAFFCLLNDETEHVSVGLAQGRIHPSRYEGIRNNQINVSLLKKELTEKDRVLKLMAEALEPAKSLYFTYINNHLKHDDLGKEQIIKQAENVDNALSAYTKLGGTQDE